MTLSIGIQHPSQSIPHSLLDINNLGFITTTHAVIPRTLLSFYPTLTMPIRTALVNGDLLTRKHFLNTLSNLGYAPALRKYSQKGIVQVVSSQLFDKDDALTSNVTEQQVLKVMKQISQMFKNVEIIIDEVNTDYLLSGKNSFSENPRFRILDSIKQSIPDVSISLGISITGNDKTKDILRTALPTFLDGLKTLDWFTFPLHFSSVAYYHPPFLQSQQKEFLDYIRDLAVVYDITSLCYSSPWQGDLLGLQDTCSIWNDDWSLKYDILGNIGNGT